MHVKEIYVIFIHLFDSGIMVLSIIFLEDKHQILLHLSILYEYQQFFQHRICFSIQPQLQFVNLYRNWRYFESDSHETWKCADPELERQIRCFPYGDRTTDVPHHKNRDL
jgi:hypothetical protein